MTKPVKGVLFDLDNTLIDWRGAGGWDYSERHHLSLVYRFLIDNKRPLSCTLDRFATTFRDTARKNWEDARQTLRTPQQINTLQATLEKYGFTPDGEISMEDIMVAYDWGKEEGVVVFPDVPDALQTLINQNIPIGIVTNSWQPMWLRDVELEHHGLLKYFPQKNLRISAADAGYLKPHPHIFYHALEQLGTSPEETLFVGDNLTADISGAHGVEMRAVLRVNADEPLPPLSSIIAPDAIVSDFADLLLLIEDWEGNITKIASGYGD